MLQNLRICLLVRLNYNSKIYLDDNMHGIIEEEEMEDEGSDEEAEIDDLAYR